MATKWHLWRSNSSTSSDSGEDRKKSRGSWAKITQILRPSEDPKERTPQDSTFLSLPFELQECVFSHLTRLDLLRLRATCWKLDQTLLHHVFREITIDCTASGSRRTGILLRHLGNPKCRAAQTAKTLKIENLVPFTHPHQSDWREQDLGSHFRPIQQNFVAPALKSFCNVTTIYWSVKVSEPYSNMCSTLASLSHLERLCLYFDRWCPTSVFPFDKFGPLRCLHVEGRDYTGPVDQGLLDSLRLLLARCTELEDFSFTLANKADQAFESPPPPSLRSLRITSLMGIREGLHNLVSLDVPFTTEESTAVWTFLATHGIQLRSITVGEPSNPLLDYLRTYAGLEELIVRRSLSSSSDASQEPFDPLLKSLCFEVLPLHEHSLAKVRLSPDSKDADGCPQHHRGMCIVKAEYLAAMGHDSRRGKQECCCGVIA
ncbi:hypothetical protein BKA70DRAFT_1278331 [Coprinopsis sp. MPI-PUGE-AT-0042]|nr:hypothetical protein BKA70DRAFT_1278331 [Coprinopsis sp. MPI-PUGE-AT-0042]